MDLVFQYDPIFKCITVYTALYYTVQHFAVLQCNCYAALHSIVVPYAILYYAVLSYTILYYTILYYTIL